MDDSTNDNLNNKTELVEEPITPAQTEPSLEPNQTKEQFTEPDIANTPNENESSDKTTDDHQAIVSGSGNSSKKTKSILAVLLVCLLIVLGFIGWKAFYNKDSPTKTVSVAVAKKDIPVLDVSVNPTPINSFYPNEEQFQVPTYLINNQIYEGLVKYDDISKIKPQLATSWTNPDDSTWVFNLKKNVKFHSGNKMTAKDVKYSLEKYASKAYGGVLAFSAKDITVVNDNQVKITTDGPDPLLLHKLAYLAIVDSKQTGDAILNGTGPYTIKQGTTPTETSVNLVAFNGYHGGHVYVKELKITAFDDDTAQVDSVVKGGAGYAVGFATQSEINKLKGLTGYKYQTQEGLGSSYIGMNTKNTKSPFANVKVRQAVNLAINRQQIINAADLSASESNQIVTQEVPGYNSSIKPTKQDVAKAKQLLTEAGYPNGFTYSLTFVSGQADKQSNEIATQLKQIGITTKPDPQKDFGAYNDKWSSGKADAFIEAYTSDLFDASDVYSYMVNDNPYYSNSQVSDLLQKASSTLGQTKRLAYLQQSSKILNDDLNVVPTYVVNLPNVYKTSLAIQPDMFVGPYFWQVYQK